jgi:cytochrome b561
MSRNPQDRWGAVSQSFHWMIVLLILAAAVIGLLMGELRITPKYFWIYTAHKSIGITVLVLMLLRLGWRLYAGAPRVLPGTPAWQRWLASATHWALYAIALAMPLSGWLYDSASGLRPFRWFGLVEMPKLVRPHEWIADNAHAVHELLFLLLVALIALHAGAALYHHMFLRDDTLRRMLPRRR